MIECGRCTLNYSNRSSSNCLDEIMLHLIACQGGLGKLIFMIESRIVGTVGHLQKIVVPRKSRGPQIRLDDLIPNADSVGRVIHLVWGPFFILAELKH